MQNQEEFRNIIAFLKDDVADKSKQVLSGKKLIEQLDALKNEKKVYSDVVSQHDDNQYYVNLVQEGGGTLGFALVGFVFALEYCNIRFLRLAGTSAGAINTVLMHYNGKPEDPKSPILFDKIRNKPLMDFVDGHSTVKNIIRNLLKKNGRVEFLVITLLVPFLLIISTLPVLSIFTNSVIPFYLIGLGMIVLTIILLVLLNRNFKRWNFGLNPGISFHQFIKDHIEDGIGTINRPTIMFKNSLHDLSDLINKIILKTNEMEKSKKVNKVNEHEKTKEFFRAFNEETNEEVVTVENKSHLKITKSIEEYFSDYTVITSEIISKNKIEFPKDVDLFWDVDDKINPADFVRASMSIPVFFKPFKKVIPKTSSVTKAWENKMFVLNQEHIPDHAFFVDGGVLSNFPINIFHDSQLLLARVPVFGARLVDSAPQKPLGVFKDILEFVMAIFNTVRHNHDKHFLVKHNFYERHSVANIDVYKTEISWLNFDLKEKEKRELMKTGVESALTFLSKYDWKKYQSERADMILNNLKQHL